MVDPKERRAAQLVKAAWLYYEEQLTQAEIGEKLGVSRVIVNRMLKEARETGLVKISIRSDLVAPLPLAKRLVDRYGLLDAFVSRPTETGREAHSALAEAAASALERFATPGRSVGIGIGRSIAGIPDALDPGACALCAFASLIGGLDIGSVAIAHNFDILTRLAAKTGGSSSYISAPSLVAKASTRDAIVEDPSVKKNLEAARSCEVAVFSVGEVDENGLLYRLGMLGDGDLAELRARGARGDVLGRFFDSEARELDIGFNKRVIGLSIDELRRIPRAILVSGGAAKREAIRILIERGVAKILVTDPETAEWLANAD